VIDVMTKTCSGPSIFLFIRPSEMQPNTCFAPDSQAFPG